MRFSGVNWYRPAISSNAAVSHADVLTIIGFTQSIACKAHCAALATTLKANQTSR